MRALALLALAPAAAAQGTAGYEVHAPTRAWIQAYPQVRELEPAPAPAPGTPNPRDLHRFGGRGKSSFAPVQLAGELAPRLEAWALQRPEVDLAQRRLLDERYDLTGRVSATARMSGGKPVPVGPVARLPKGVASWEALAALGAERILERDLFPYKPLPHPLQSTGGAVFPSPAVRKELSRVDVSFDLPRAYLPEDPPPLFLATRPDLGDVTRGRLIETDNFYDLLAGALTAEQLEGFLLLNTPVPANWHNQTDRRATPLEAKAGEGMRCFDCHVNGHTNGAIALDPSARPQLVRARLDTPSLRGLAVQGPLSLRRSLADGAHFTEVEEYHDGDAALAEALGNKKLNASAARKIAAFMNVVAFPPAPKLDVLGRLDPAQASASERRGEALFFGKARCADCHRPPYYTDNRLHDLRVERFYRGRAEGLAKTFPLRGIKDSPPYLHDGRLPTLEDAVEFFDLVLGTRLGPEEKRDLAEFLRAL